MGVQAVPEETEAAVQATANVAVSGSTQYEPRQMETATADQLASSESLSAFLESVSEHYEYALQQNEVSSPSLTPSAMSTVEEGRQLGSSRMSTAGGGGGDLGWADREDDGMANKRL